LVAGRNESFAKGDGSYCLICVHQRVHLFMHAFEPGDEAMHFPVADEIAGRQDLCDIGHEWISGSFVMFSYRHKPSVFANRAANINLEAVKVIIMNTLSPIKRIFAN
jgi:hypothetical protein